MPGVALETVTYRDAKGQTAKLRFWLENAEGLSAATVAASIVLDFNALTNAAEQAQNGPSSTRTPGVFGAAAVYEDVGDKAVLTFITAAGDLHRYQVPAPKTSIFKADGQTVDPANAAVAALVTAMLAPSGASPNNANVSTADGRPLTAFIGGIRQRRKTIRKMTIYTKSADLLTPAE